MNPGFGNIKSKTNIGQGDAVGSNFLGIDS